MAIKIYGTTVSAPTTRAMASLYEKELAFEFVAVDMKAREHKKDHFLAMNPFGQIPVFEDGDLKLFESRAITQYIAHNYADKGTQLTCPGKAMAIQRVWMEVEAQKFDPVGGKLAGELFYKPLFGMATDPSAVEELEAKLASLLDVYEARLSQTKYLACDCFTLADLHHLPAVHFLKGTRAQKLFDSRPHVSAWVADITARPAWAKVVAMQKK